MLFLSALLLLAFGGVFGVSVHELSGQIIKHSLIEVDFSDKADVLGCEFTTYPNTWYHKDYYQTAKGKARHFDSVEECFSFCLLQPECRSINVKDLMCSFHSSSIQGDVKDVIKAKKAFAIEGWTHYKLEKCPEEPSPAPVGCGIQASSLVPSLTRIIGGKEARANSWPWKAYFEIKQDNGDTSMCGSSLLRVKDDVEASDILLTAGHCVSFLIENTKNHALYRPSQTKAVFGTHNRDMYQAGVQVRIGDQVVAHPQFNLSELWNDVALIRLSKPVKFSNKIRPICLPSQDEEIPVGKMCATAGWGRTSSTSQKTSSILKELVMPIHDPAVCEASWGDDYIENQMICAGSLNGDEGTCSGDSGGMLACKENGKWVLQGATSFGVSRVCIKANIPKVFARISSYVDWIKTTVAGMTTL